MTEFNDQGYGVDETRDIAFYHRWDYADDGQLERFIIVLNFSDNDQCVDVPFSASGEWQDLLNGREYCVEDYQPAHQLVNSNWGKLLYLKG